MDEVLKLRNAVEKKLIQDYGSGDWGFTITESIVRRGLKNGKILLAWFGVELVGTLTLSKKKPWAVNKKIFPRSDNPIYMIAMAISPKHQRKGIGAKMVKKAISIAKTDGHDFIHLDSYNAEAGAGGFYEKCGFNHVCDIVYKECPLSYWSKGVI
ncbi:MAG: GNAT family N-acetyltransferase [Planctomycetes bacterium]|nr:GNAT family N-acetyltransferase [Planctomycetota bacterium]